VTKASAKSHDMPFDQGREAKETIEKTKQTRKCVNQQTRKLPQNIRRDLPKKKFKKRLKSFRIYVSRTHGCLKSYACLDIVDFNVFKGSAKF
jgi:hypothetical protein